MAINKEIDLRFVIGYTPPEFRADAPHAGRGQGEREAAGHRRRRARPRVDSAFASLGDPEAHAKILIDPKSAAASRISA